MFAALVAVAAGIATISTFFGIKDPFGLAPPQVVIPVPPPPVPVPGLGREAAVGKPPQHAAQQPLEPSAPLPGDVNATSVHLIKSALYRFGDEVIKAYFEGENITLYYFKANKKMIEIGAQDALYGRLINRNGALTGWVQGRSKACRPVPYDISGHISPDLTVMDFNGMFQYINGETCQPNGSVPTHATLKIM